MIAILAMYIHTLCYDTYVYTCSHIHIPCDDCVVLLTLVVVEVTADETLDVWCTVLDIVSCWLAVALMVVLAVGLTLVLTVALTIVLAILVDSVVVNVVAIINGGDKVLNASKIPE